MLLDGYRVNRKSAGGFDKSRKRRERGYRRELSQRTARERSTFESLLHESHDLIGGNASPESDTRHDHGFVTTHCVTGMAARQPCMPPTGSRRETARRRSMPPCSA